MIDEGYFFLSSTKQLYNCLKSCTDNFAVILQFLQMKFFFLFLNFALNRPAGKLAFIDHVVGNQPDDQMVSIAEW